MNGDDLLSELRQEVRSYADAREVDSQALEVFVMRLATALGKRPLVEQAEGLAQRFENCGADTWGDLRNLNYAILTNDVGMRQLDARAFELFLSTAPHSAQAAESQEGEYLGSADTEAMGEEPDEELDEEVSISVHPEQGEDPAGEDALQPGEEPGEEEEGGVGADPADEAEDESDEEEEDLYDHSGEDYLEQQLQEEEAAGSARLQRQESKGAAAPASITLGGDPAGQQAAKQAAPSQVSGDTTETAMSHLSSMAGSMSQAISVLTEGQKAIQAAAAQQARGSLPALRLQGGLKPSVKETKAWMVKVSEKLQDVARHSPKGIRNVAGQLQSTQSKGIRMPKVFEAKTIRNPEALQFTVGMGVPSGNLSRGSSRLRVFKMSNQVFVKVTLI